MLKICIDGGFSCPNRDGTKGYGGCIFCNGSGDFSTAKTTSKGDAEVNSESESESETSDNMELTYTKKGNQGVNTYAHDMIEFRTSIIDVVTQIIDDKRIKNLFMQVF